MGLFDIISSKTLHGDEFRSKLKRIFAAEIDTRLLGLKQIYLIIEFDLYQK